MWLFEKALSGIKGSKSTFFAIVTRGHRYDQDCMDKDYINVSFADPGIIMDADTMEDYKVLLHYYDKMYRWGRIMAWLWKIL